MQLRRLQLVRGAGRTKGLDGSHGSRAFSTIINTRTEQVDVAVGSSGSIKLDIIPSDGSPSSSPLLVYLPRGPLALTLPESRNIASLAYATNATVVRINYRLSPRWPFPTPVHDVLAGYDWILRSLWPQHSQRHGRQEPSQATKLGVCGELLGGTLAAMLALTECPIHQRGIGAACLGNPIVDWTAMYPVPPTQITTKAVEGAVERTRARKRKASEGSWREFATSDVLSTADLLRARGTLFRSPEHFFDHFASPLLFFRTPSSDVPLFSTSEDEIFDRVHQETSTLEFIKKRRAHKRYPALRSGLRLPPLRMSVGRSNVLRDQGIEFAEACRRSIALYEGQTEERGIDEKEPPKQERVSVAEIDGHGLWDEHELGEIGAWFRKSLA